MYSTACGETVYGAYTEENGYVWNPPHQQNIIECLGPEVCPPFTCNCPKDDKTCVKIPNSNRKGHDLKWFKKNEFAARGATNYTVGDNDEYLKLSAPQCDNPDSEWPGSWFACELTRTNIQAYSSVVSV